MLAKKSVLVYNSSMSDICILKSNIKGNFEAPLIGNYGGDYSFAGMFLARAALDSSVICLNLNPHSEQSGMQVLDVLRAFGARVTRAGNSVNVRAEKLKGTNTDVTEFPQLAPVISLLALFASGKTRITGFAQCTEFQTLIGENLHSLGARCEYGKNDLWIWPQKKPEHCVLNAKDHLFMAMALILISTYTEGETVVRNVDSLFKRYPEFLDIFTSLGGKYKLQDIQL